LEFPRGAGQMEIFLKGVDNLKNVKYSAENGSLVRILPSGEFAPARCFTLPMHDMVFARK